MNRRFYPKPNKYRNRKTKIAGRTFASIKESRWYLIFLHQQAKGEIRDFKCQVPFELIPKTDKFRGVSYIADFVVKDWKGNSIVYDVKSPITRKNPVYIIKRKLMYWHLGLEIVEV